MVDIEKEQFAEQIMALESSLYRVAISITHSDFLAEEAVAETIFRAYTKRKTLKDPEKFRPWLMRILANECCAQMRKQKRFTGSEVPDIPQPESQNHDLWSLVQRLPETYQSVIVLYYYEGFSVREIAKMLKLREGGIRTRLSRGRSQLKQWLTEEERIYEEI